MDLMALGKTALLIPTPGQPEQQYLAKRMEEKRYFHSQNQQNLNLEKAMAYRDDFTIAFSVNHHLIDRAINDLMRCLNSSDDEAMNTGKGTASGNQ